MPLHSLIDLLRDDEPTLTAWVRPLADPVLDADYWRAMHREHPSLLAGLTHLPIEREVTALDGRWAVAVVEVVRLIADAGPRAA